MTNSGGYIDSLKTEYTTKTAFTKVKTARRILRLCASDPSRFGKDVLYNEGLNVYTTLNLRRQEVAERYFGDAVARQNEISENANKYYNSAVDRALFDSYSVLRMVFNLPGMQVKNDFETVFNKRIAEDLLDSLDIIALMMDSGESNEAIESFRTLVSGISSSLKVEGAFLAIEPPTGYITSMIGGSGFSVDNQYNRAIQARRQPGSAFKPFVYGSGIEAKLITPSTTLPDAPIVDIDGTGEHGPRETMKAITTGW